MGKGAVLSLKITGDASGAKAALDEADGHAGSFGSSLGKLAGLAAGAFAVDKVVDFGKQAFDAASNLEQMSGAVEAVFGKSADQIDKLAEKAHTAVGLSTADYDQMASVIGSQLKNAGVPMDQLAGKTDGLIKQGADMSAVFGGSAADAVEALSSVMKGEFDPIEKYGVSLNQSTINAALAAKGQDKLTGAALKQAQVAAALDIVTKQTTATHGQFAAQSGTAAEKSQQLGAWFDNLKAKIGAGMLPIFATLTTFFTEKVSPALDTLFRKGGPVAQVFAQVGSFVTTQLVPALTDLYNWLAPKIIPIWHDIAHVIADVVVPAFRVIWDFVQKYVVPIFKSVLGPALQGLTGYWHAIADALEKNKGKFQELYDKVKPFLDFIKNDVAPFVGGAFKLAFEGLSKVIGPVVSTIGWILDKAGSVLGFIGKVGSFIFGGGSGGKTGGAKRLGGPLRGAAAGGPLLAAAGTLGGGGAGPSTAPAGLTLAAAGDTYNITINGALDPTAVADQIARLLDTRARRLGQRPAFSA